MYKYLIPDTMFLFSIILTHYFSRISIFRLEINIVLQMYMLIKTNFQVVFRGLVVYFKMLSGSKTDEHASLFLEMKNIVYSASCLFLVILYNMNLFQRA